MQSLDTYWNPALETLPVEKLRELQLVKFKRILKWGYERSKLYRRLYEAAGLMPEDIKTWDDIKKVPIIDKGSYREAQYKEPWPYGDSLCIPLEDVTVYHQTSGTTGQPVFQPDTWQDWEWQAEIWSHYLWAMGFRNTDRVFIPFGYNVFIAYWAGHYAAEKVGCEVVSGAMLNTEERIMKMKDLRATAFMATPTYVLGMADGCRKLGMDPRDLHIKKILCAGEPGGSVPTTKRRMEEAWGCPVYDHVGATEMGSWGYECTFKPGGLHVNEGFFLVELLDLETGEPIEEPNKLGRIVITAFDRMAQPCIRCDSKDVAMWSDKNCECGRTYRVLKGGIQGRTDHISKVKGVLFSPVAVEEVVRSMPQLGDEYELIVKKEGDIDKIILKYELNPGFEGQEKEVEAELARNLRVKTNLGYVYESHPYGSLPRYLVKAKRYKDLRKEL
ncbi:phenylacetate--CoA ligase family protein [Desulfoscipio gibsoniae]|uniref:Coenzyme F390 synthetase n=1 Tax=Desulfoscipio gibsoniae DSM 7213 TaxID=767817 RepID=R4KJ65_9FIRM|nr:AMP-binding protein [Desulfoscipio gibsoniae]AGL03263.1 coenzyme F390 synthetase [Desulfoscipio gibsoniae DSM 7213]